MTDNNPKPLALFQPHKEERKMVTLSDNDLYVVRERT